jgi:hypothetical protein
MAKPERDPAAYVGTKLALELIHTATFEHARVRQLADGQHPPRDKIIGAAHRRLTEEMERIKARQQASEEFQRKYGRPPTDEPDDDATPGH